MLQRPRQQAEVLCTVLVDLALGQSSRKCRRDGKLHTVIRGSWRGCAEHRLEARAIRSITGWKRAAAVVLVLVPSYSQPHRCPPGDGRQAMEKQGSWRSNSKSSWGRSSGRGWYGSETPGRLGGAVRPLGHKR